MHDNLESHLPLFFVDLVFPSLEITTHFVCIHFDEVVVDFRYHRSLVVFID